MYDTPIFLSQDAEIIKAGISIELPKIMEKINLICPQMYKLCAKIDNEFSIEENMYHILCGKILDG